MKTFNSKLKYLGSLFDAKGGAETDVDNKEDMARNQMTTEMAEDRQHRSFKKCRITHEEERSSVVELLQELVFALRRLVDDPLRILLQFLPSFLLRHVV